MGKVGGYPGRVNNIVERQLRDGGVQLEQQGQRLTDTCVIKVHIYLIITEVDTRAVFALIENTAT